MKPLSGSGARGLMVETMKHFGPIHLPDGLPVLCRDQPKQLFILWQFIMVR